MDFWRTTILVCIRIFGQWTCWTNTRYLFLLPSASLFSLFTILNDPWCKICITQLLIAKSFSFETHRASHQVELCSTWVGAATYEFKTSSICSFRMWPTLRSNVFNSLIAKGSIFLSNIYKHMFRLLLLLLIE